MDRLDVTDLSVRSFYGAPQSGLDVSLGAGLSVVVGPNGQGKTTLARAIHGALWPETVREYRPSYTAQFTIGGDAWDVEIESGEARYVENGKAADRPALPDASYRSRYWLSLNDLVVDDGRDFAEAVRRDASGGVDLSLARAALGYRPAAPRTLDTARKATEAATDVRRRRNAYATLRADADGLPALAARAEEAALAADRAVLLDLMERRAAAHAAAVEATRLADAYPSPMANVARDTLARYETLADDVRRTSEALDKAKQASAEASNDLRGHAWASSDTPSATELSARVRALDEATRAVADAERDAAEARSRADRAAQALRDGDAADAAPLAPDALDQVTALAQEAGRTRAQADEMAARAQVLKAHHNRIQPHDADALRRGVDALRTWLAYSLDAEPVKPILAPGPVWIVAALLAVIALAVGVLASPWALLLLAGTAALAWVAFTLGQRPAASDNPAARARESYDLLRLDRPAEWTPVHVEQTLAGLDRQSAEQDVRRLWRERIDEVERTIEDLGDAVSHVATREKELSEALGLRVPRGSEALLVLAHQVVASDAAARDLASAEGLLAQAVAARDAALAAVNALLSGVPIAPVNDAAEAAAAVTAVAQGTSARDGLRRASAHANADVDAAAAQHTAAREVLGALLTPIGLDAEARPGAAVAKLVSAFDDYHEARTAAARASALADEADRVARAHDGFESGLVSLSASEIALRRDAARLTAGGRDGHLESAARTRERVDQARASDALQDAQARHGAALDTLEADYDDLAGALVGDALATFVEDDTRDEHLPRVFQRARDLLATITADRYRLDFDADTGAFRAFDTSKERSLALDALSSGTRLQLLLAVRLAFAEVQEVGFRLPVVVDEALATSDDDRAASIIDAVLGVCRGDGAQSGRQVVVFTSQSDEAARWVSRAEALADVGCRVVSLPGTPGGAVDLGAAPAERTTRAVPDPAGHTTESYAQATNAPAWSARDPLASLPVALVLEPEAAHACLRAGIDTWGPLRAAIRRGSDGAVPLSEPEARTLIARVGAVDAWQQAWLVGRGRPVDREALAASGLLGVTVSDDVDALVQDAAGDARALIRALRTTPPVGMRRARIDEIESYLTANGYLPTGAPLSDADMRASVAAATDPSVLDDALATLARLRTHAEALTRARSIASRLTARSGDGA